MLTLTSPLEYMFAAARVPLSGVVLDAACGRGQFGLYIRAQRDKHDNPIELIGGDVWPDFLSKTKATRCYDHIVRCDIRYLPFRNGKKQIDMAFGLEVIEHQNKEDGYKLMSELEAISNSILITTPNGFLPQENKHKDDNPWQVHKSGWRPKDFKAKGYRVRGIPEYRFGLTRYFLPLILTWKFFIGAKSLLAIK